MKLYTKHGMIYGSEGSINNNIHLIHRRPDVFCKKLEFGFNINQYSIRKHAYFDIDMLGLSYINTPFLLKVKR